MSLAGNEFMLSHFFENVSSMKVNEPQYSPWVIKFVVAWSLEVIRSDNSIGVYLYCSLPVQDNPCAVHIEFEFEVLSSKGKSKKMLFHRTFTTDLGSGWPTFLPWDVLEKEYLVDDTFQLLAYVKILTATGIQKKKIERFLRTTHKPHRRSPYCGRTEIPHLQRISCKNTNNEENELHGVNAQDFQNFLEEIHGKDVINEDTVGGILKLARRFDWESCVYKCVEFLIEESKKTYKEKLRIGSKYQLKELINHCIMELDTKEAIRAAIPNNIHDMDPTADKILLQKSLCLE